RHGERLARSRPDHGHEHRRRDERAAARAQPHGLRRRRRHLGRRHGAPRLDHPGREELARRRRERDQPLLDVSPLTLSVTNGVLQLNRANGGPTKLNWKTFPPAHTKLPTIAFSDTVDLHVSGTFSAARPSPFPATANGSLDLGQITDTAVGTD